jgi:hypothetical protein
MYLSTVAVNDTIIDRSLKTITTRLPSVTELILGSYSAINRLPDGLLDIVPNVKRIGLRGQNLTEIPVILKQMPALESADLCFNTIKNLNAQDRAWMNKYCKISPTDVARPDGCVGPYEGLSWEETMK